VRRALVALAAALVCAAPAQAFVRSKNNSGLHLWWATRGHSFQIDAQGTPDSPSAGVFAAIRKSYQTWAGVTCSDLKFDEEPLATDPAARKVGFFQGETNHNLVFFRTQSCKTAVPANDPCVSKGGCSNQYDCWDKGDAVIATTTTTSTSSTGQIQDTDIEINDAPQGSGSKFIFTTVDGPKCTLPGETNCVSMDVQNTITHEAGHTLGLDHPPDHPEATMYATAPVGETSKRVLAQDDTDGICSIYPAGKPTVTDVGDISIAPGGGCGCSQAQTGPGAALCALLLLLQMRRRSSKKPQLAMSKSVAPATAARFQSGNEN